MWEWGGFRRFFWWGVEVDLTKIHCTHVWRSQEIKKNKISYLKVSSRGVSRENVCSQQPFLARWNRLQGKEQKHVALHLIPVPSIVLTHSVIFAVLNFPPLMTGMRMKNDTQRLLPLRHSLVLGQPASSFQNTQLKMNPGIAMSGFESNSGTH